MLFKVKFPIGEIKRKLKATAKKIERKQIELLEAVGVDLLSKAQQDYRTKSRGGTGTDGIQWKPLAASTIKAKGKRGKGNEKRKTTKGGKARPGAGSAVIGINTGLQLNSAAPGFKGPDGKGGNVKVVTTTDVTVGYGREYSGHFDEDRPLLPVTLPEAWRKSIKGIVVRGVERILREGLK